MLSPDVGMSVVLMDPMTPARDDHVRDADALASALLVDLYELTMVAAYRQQAMADRPATFSLFVRSLPDSRGYLIAAGLDDCLRWLEGLRFGPEELAALERLDLFDAGFLDWLGGLRFTGSVRAMPEGTVVFAGEPILEVDGSIAEAQLAETFLLNQVTVQTILATKAARCRHAAAGRSVIDFALRRSHGIDAGMKLARVGRLVGLAGTSNVAGADRYGIAASGTMAHSFVQAHEDETAAFRAFSQLFGPRTVLLVDTYDTPTGVNRAIEVALEQQAAGQSIRGIRLDSGDLGALARDARRRFDDAGLTDMKIFASGGLDEYSIAELVADGAPIDGFGVGSSLGTSDDAATLDSVYKLVSFDGRAVRKTSTGKATWPDAKQVWRADDWSHDILARADDPAVAGAHPLLVEVMRDGRRTWSGHYDLDDAHRHFEQQWNDLPEPYKALHRPERYRVDPSPGLQDLTDRIDDQLAARHDREETRA